MPLECESSALPLELDPRAREGTYFGLVSLNFESFYHRNIDLAVKSITDHYPGPLSSNSEMQIATTLRQGN